MYCPNPDCPDLDEAGIPSEYLPEATHCGVCGASLVAEIPHWAHRRSSPKDRNVVLVMKVHNAALLSLAKSLLESADIEFTVRNELVQGLIGSGQLGAGFNVLTGPPEIHVEEDDFDEARALLAQLGQPDDESSKPEM